MTDTFDGELSENDIRDLADFVTGIAYVSEIEFECAIHGGEKRIGWILNGLSRKEKERLYEQISDQK